MTIYKPFKISYRKAFRFIFIFIVFGISSVGLIYFLKKLGIPNYILFSLSYLMPFILFFSFFYIKTKKENIKIDFLCKISSWKIYPLLFILIFCGMIITDYIASFINENVFFFEKIYQKIEELLEKESYYPISIIISTTLLAPLCEEFFFRGILLNGLLNNKIHPIKSIFFSSFLFGLIHMNPWQFIGGIFIGSILGLVYFCTRSICNCILLHALNNSLAIINLLYKNGATNISINTNLPIFLITCFILIIFSYILIYQTKKIWKNWFSLPII